MCSRCLPPKEDILSCHAHRAHGSGKAVGDNYNLKSHKYVCITTYQPDTKSNPNPNPNPNLTTKQHAIVNIELNILTCLTYPEKFTRGNVVAPSVPTSVVIVTRQWERPNGPCQNTMAKLLSSPCSVRGAILVF